MQNVFNAFRPRLRPLAAALAFSIASSSSFGGVRHAPIDAPAALLLARDHRDASAPSPPRGPAPVVVTSCDDSGPGTLREAYFSAVDGTEIDLTQLACSRITLTSGALTDPGGSLSVTITGPGKYALAIDGNYANRVFVHNGSGTLSISGVTITHGSYSGAYGGGCIYAYGDVELAAAIVTGCQMSSTGTAKAYGGAIYSHGTVYVFGGEVSGGRAHAASANSAGGGIWANMVNVTLATVTGNVVSGDGSHYARGGGVFALRDVQLLYSTISNNEADSGAGAFFAGAVEETMLVAESTISGNRATGAGGGLYAKYRQLTIAGSTITQNTSDFPFGAGLYVAYATELESTIVAGNTSQDGLSASDIGGVAGTTITGANNLVLASTLALPSDTMASDPMLGPLQNNGGYTATHALLSGSPAIDRGNNVVHARNDQRFFDATVDAYERVVGPGPDIGAFEFGAPDRIFANGFEAEL